jgi:hypothetical protein
MWYKKAQLGPLLPSLLIDPFLLTSKKGYTDTLAEKIKSIIQSFPEDKQLYYSNKLNQISQQSKNNLPSNIIPKDSIETWQNLANEINQDLNQQNSNSFVHMKFIVDQRDVGSFDSDNQFVDADKIFKQYLDAKGKIDIFQVLSNSNDLFEISKFFIDNATDPKFDIAKKIMKKFPTKFMKYVDVVDLLLNFYLVTKLQELKSIIQNRNPQSDNDELAVMFIDSKLVLHNAKIGASLFNVTNKNIFGALLSSLSSLATESIQSLQDQMGVDQSIKKYINQSGK